MIFNAFGKFINLGGDSGKSSANYLERILNRVLYDLESGLKRLRFVDNFNAVRLSATINSDSDTLVKHKLNDRVDSFLVVNGVAGIVLSNVISDSKVSKDSVNLVLDTDVYGAGVTKTVDIILFK